MLFFVKTCAFQVVVAAEVRSGQFLKGLFRKTYASDPFVTHNERPWGLRRLIGAPPHPP